MKGHASIKLMLEGELVTLNGPVDEVSDEELFFNHWFIYKPELGTFILNGSYDEYITEFRKTFTTKDKEGRM